jgi:hypothetical protein
MSKTALALLAFALATAQVQAQAWADKLVLANGGSLTHDFGSVPRGAQLYHRFPITNIYAVPLEIVSARTSCGCATVTPSTRLLKPRESGYLEVNMDARRFTGPKRINLYITVGPEYTSTATLQITANARADVVFNPGQVDFGIVSRGQTPTQAMDVEYAGVLDWRVTEVVKNSGPVDATIEELYRKPGQPGQVGYRLKVTLKPDVPPGPLKHELLLKTNDPASPLVAVLVEANVQAALTLSPDKITFGTLQVGETITRRIQIRGNREFRILSVAGMGDDVTADLSSTPALVQIVTFKYQPQKAGDLHRQFTLKTDLPDGPTATVTAEGSAAAP